MKSAKSVSGRRRLGLFGGFMALAVGTAAAVSSGTGVGLAAAGSTGSASTGKADYSVSVAPSSQEVQVGKTAAFTVTVTATSGFTGTVSLASTASPSGTTTSSFDRPSVTMTTSGSVQTSTLSVATTRSTPLGDIALSVTGTSGKTSRSGSAKLTVAKTPGALSMTAGPASANVAPGVLTAYTVTLNRTGRASEVPVALSLSGQPAGSTVSFSPNDTLATSVTLQVTPPTSAGSGTYPMVVRASGGEFTAEAAVSLNVVYAARSFAISGNADRLLAPGVAAPLDLLLTNSNSRTLSVTNLSVVVSTGSGACPVENFSVSQYAGNYPLTVAAGSAVRLSTLLAASAPNLTDAQRQALLPTLRMLNLNRNQDGCKGGVPVTLSYSGSGTGN